MTIPDWLRRLPPWKPALAEATPPDIVSCAIVTVVAPISNTRAPGVAITEVVRALAPRIVTAEEAIASAPSSSRIVPAGTTIVCAPPDCSAVAIAWRSVGHAAGMHVPPSSPNPVTENVSARAFVLASRSASSASARTRAVTADVPCTSCPCAR